MKVKACLLVFALLSTLTLYSQEKFSYTAEGLNPNVLTSNIADASQQDLFEKTLAWLKENYPYADVETSKESGNTFIVFTDLKDNLIKVSKRYYNSRYKIKVRFEAGQFSFEPLEFATKQNSKYDMGWTVFDFNNGAEYFKKGKPIKATKSYVKGIPRLFNELMESLREYVGSE